MLNSQKVNETKRSHRLWSSMGFLNVDIFI